MDIMIEHNDGTVTWIRRRDVAFIEIPVKIEEQCAVSHCKQPVDGTCKRCGDRLCYDHLCSHKSRVRDYTEASQQSVLW